MIFHPMPLSNSQYELLIDRKAGLELGVQSIFREFKELVNGK